jgi:hypothetical protein
MALLVVEVTRLDECSERLVSLPSGDQDRREIPERRCLVLESVRRATQLDRPEREPLRLGKFASTRQKLARTWRISICVITSSGAPARSAVSVSFHASSSRPSR